MTDQMKCSHLKCLNKLISLKCPQVSQQQQKHFAKLDFHIYIYIYIFIYLLAGLWQNSDGHSGHLPAYNVVMSIDCISER